MNVEDLNEHFDRNKERLVEEFFEFLRFKSISSEPQYKEDVVSCCEWLSDYVSSFGMEAEIWSTPGHPSVFASWMKAGKDKPTVLLYNHYDVQPVDPLELWESAPFEPRLEGARVYARGAQDNKGQCFYTINAIKTLLEKNGELPINVKLLIEGEEEMGSGGLNAILDEKKEALQADYLMIVDLGLISMDAPSVCLGTRGIVTMDVEVSEAPGDLHSGSFGGIAYNPNRALCEMLAKLKTEDGRVAVPGFYDNLEKLSAEQKELILSGIDEESLVLSFGFQPSGQEDGFSFIESAWYRPTMEINGVAGGYYGEGFKTVIPAKAIAKLSCRLVPAQDPQRIGKLVGDYLQEIAPGNVKVETKIHPFFGEAVRANAKSSIVAATKKAYEEVLELDCGYSFEGGTIPVAPALARVSGAQTVLMGYGLSGDQIHAPNEYFDLNRIRYGHATIARTLFNCSHSL